MQAASARLTDALTWRVVAIILSIAISVIAIIMVIVGAYSANRTQLEIKERVIIGNDSSWINEANIRSLNLERLCFEPYPYCTGYDETDGCIANGGHSCFNNVTIFGSLTFANGASYNGPSVFNEFSIGDWACERDEFGNAHCSGGTLYPGALGLTLYFDPDHFASLRRQNNTLIIDSQTLMMTGAIVGVTRFSNVVMVDDRVVFANKSIISRVADHLVVLGFNMTEFVDNVLVSSNWTLAGRVVGSNMKFDDGVNIDLYGPHTFIIQHDHDMDVCAPNGIAKFCGETAILEGTTSTQINGPVTNLVHFVGGFQVDGPAIFSSGQTAEDLTVINLNVTNKLFVFGQTTLYNLLRMFGEIQTSQLTVNGTSTLQWTFVEKSLTVGGISTFNGPVIILNGTYIGGNSLVSDTANATITTTGLLNIQNPSGEICMGMYNTSGTTLAERCALHVSAPPESCVSVGCLQAHVLEIDNIEFDEGDFKSLNVSNRICLLRLFPLSGDWHQSCAIYADKTVNTGRVDVQVMKVDDLQSDVLTVTGTETHSGPEVHTGPVSLFNVNFSSTTDIPEFYNQMRFWSFLNWDSTFASAEIGAGVYAHDTSAWDPCGTDDITWPCGSTFIPNKWTNRRVININADVYFHGYVWADSFISKYAQFQDAVDPTENPSCGFAPGYTSDKRMKTNISAVDESDSLTRIKKMAIYDYEFKPEFLHVNRREPGIHRGVIAQELQEIVPDAVGEYQHYLTVNYNLLVPDMINAIKSLAQQNAILRNQVDTMQQQLRDIQNRI